MLKLRNRTFDNYVTFTIGNAYHNSKAFGEYVFDFQKCECHFKAYPVTQELLKAFDITAELYEEICEALGEVELWDFDND